MKRLKTGANRPLGDKRQVVRKSPRHDDSDKEDEHSSNEERNTIPTNSSNNDENRPIDHHYHHRRDDEYYHGHHRGRREIKSPPPPPSSSQQDASQSQSQSQSQETKFIVTLTGVDEAQFAKSAAAKQRRGGLFEIDAQDEELIYEGDAGYDDFDMLNADNQPDQQLVNEHFR